MEPSADATPRLAGYEYIANLFIARFTDAILPYAAADGTTRGNIKVAVPAIIFGWGLHWAIVNVDLGLGFHPMTLAFWVAVAFVALALFLLVLRHWFVKSMQATQRELTQLSFFAEAAAGGTSAGTGAMEALLDNKADPNQGRGDGITALYMAASRGHAGAVQLLLDRNAHPEQAMTDEHARVPLHAASQVHL